MKCLGRPARTAQSTSRCFAAVQRLMVSATAPSARGIVLAPRGWIIWTPTPIGALMPLPPILGALTKAYLTNRAANAVMGPSLLVPYQGTVQSVQDTLEALKNLASTEPEEDYKVNQYGQTVSASGEPFMPGLVDFSGLSYEAPTNFQEPEPEKFDVTTMVPDWANMLSRDEDLSYFHGEGAPFGAGYFPVDSLPQVLPSDPESMVYDPFNPEKGRNLFLAQGMATGGAVGALDILRRYPWGR